MIYVAHILDGQYIKVGYCGGSPAKRIAGLQTGCPFEIRLIFTVPGSLLQEQALHSALRRAFSQYRITIPPNEWYPGQSEIFASFLFYLRDSIQEAFAFLEDYDPTIIIPKKERRKAKYSAVTHINDGVYKPNLMWPRKTHKVGTRRASRARTIVDFLTQ